MADQPIPLRYATAANQAGQPAVAYVLASDPARALRVALERDDPEDRYLDLVLVAVACGRRGDEPGARAAAALAVERYRPIVEEGLYVLYARYLTELASRLPPPEVAAFVTAMEPEVEALGALPAAADPPLPFLALYNDLFLASRGWQAFLSHARHHPASHLLLADLARRAPPGGELGREPGRELDQELAGLAHEAAREAADLAGKALGGADPFLRDRLRRSLLRQVAAHKALFARDPELAARELPAIPFEALALLPRGLRLEALLAMSAALAPLPAAQRAALYPHFLQAAHPPGIEAGSMLRRQAGAIARITAPFLDAEPLAAGDLLGLVDWFLAEDAYLGEGAAEEAARNFALALLPLGPPGGGALARLLDWSESNAPGGAPAVLAAWAVACCRSPADLRPDCFASPERSRRVVREAPPELRGAWAAEALAGIADRLEEVILSLDLDLQRAVAALLTHHPDHLAAPALASAARRVILGEQDGGPYARTLDLLGPEPAPYTLAVLLDSRVASRGYVAPEHDHALRQIVTWAVARAPDAALRLAAGFGTRNHVSWLLGSLLADGVARDLDPEAIRQSEPHPFLLGAYLLETGEDPAP